ncbi:MAG TPA: hypothetical protein VEL76_26560 [Gemmataceae bacterium]|nr:hypothetical protein [Gemmataceae bacterium]
MGNTIRQAPQRWDADLVALGFRPEETGAYRRNGTLLTPGRGWVAVEENGENANGDPLTGQLGLPGLWRQIRSGDRVRHVFELPESALAAPPDPETESENESPLRACIEWAVATATGGVADGWQPPPYAEVESWIPIGRLTMQCGPLLRQGELIHAPGRLALRFPIVSAIPADLPEVRREWLHELLADAQDRWRLVRVGLTVDETAALAEVDLTCCPHAVLEGLFKTSLDALRWVVEWLVKSADFLADTDVTCRAVEVCRVRALPAERLVSHG